MVWAKVWVYLYKMQDELICTLRLFADDVLVYHKITHNDDTLALQRDLDKLGLWADRWPDAVQSHQLLQNVCLPE